MVSAITPGPNLFRDIKRISGYGKRKHFPLINGCEDSADSAESLAKHFESIHNNAFNIQSVDQEVVDNYIMNLKAEENVNTFHFTDNFPSNKNTNLTNEVYSVFTDNKTVKEFIMARRNIKSMGLNKIANIVLKKLPPEYINFLVIIINNAYNNCYFPSLWKMALITPIPKSLLDSSDISHFRPISLLCNESKIYELFLKEKIQDFCFSYGIGNLLQFGFSPGKSTGHAMTYFSEYVQKGYKKKEPCLVVSIDLRKAFDSVWIDGLIFKMGCMNFPRHLCKLLLDYLSNRKFKVIFNNTPSEEHPISTGVPQGSILGPPLFNIFISDFPLDWENEAKSIFFADDILIFKSSKNVRQLITNMNSFLDTLKNYFKRWKLTINISKCEAILLRNYESFISKPQKIFKQNDSIRLLIENERIEVRDQIKYLGVVFHKKGSIIPQVDHMIRKGRGAFSLLKGIFLKKKLSSKVKLTCYKQLIKPIFTYGFAGWCSISSNQMKRLRSLERKVLYKCLPIEEAYFKDNINNCYKLIPKKQLYNKFHKLDRLDCSIFNAFVRFVEKLQFSDVVELANINNLDYLNEQYENIAQKYLYKSFAPSFLYKLFKDGKTHNLEGVLTFFNRKFNSNNLDEYVYDLANPD